LDVRVGDAADESPIPKADIRLYVFGEGNFSRQGYADAGGRYTFLGVAAGAYTVVAQQIDYETASERVEVFPGETAPVSISLRRKANTPQAKPGRGVSSSALSIPRAAQKEFEAGRASLATDPSVSVLHFLKAIELYPKFAEAHVFMAAAYLKLKKREEAIKATDQAIQVDPAFSQAHTLRGRLWVEDREFNKAEASLKESLRLDPGAWDAHFELARCYYNMNRLLEAMDQAQQARELSPSNPITHLLLADIYLKQDQRKNALAELEAYAKAEPTSPLLPRIKQKIAKLRGQP
jgi:tetratricopeptide (TPR) repeat protein